MERYFPKKNRVHEGVSISISYSYGNKGPGIAKMQQLLLAAGYAIKVDGDFGAQTERIVKDFQKKEELRPDGLIGQKTQGVLKVRAEKNTTTSFREINEFIKEELEDNRGVSDGEFSLEDASEYLNIEIAVIQAVSEVESSGSGFLPDGRPKILFEGHVFWKQLKKHGMNPTIYTLAEVDDVTDILYEHWTKEHYKGGAGEYHRIEKASSIYKEAALESASWGKFQIMGYHWKSLGYGGVQGFVYKMKLNQGEHLRAFVKYIEVNNLAKYLRDKDWGSFALRYNGPGYKENKYDTKMEKAYDKYKSSKA